MDQGGGGGGWFQDDSSALFIVHFVSIIRTL